MRTLRLRTRGTDVKILQGRLNLEGIRLKVDGSFGNATRDAVLIYQKKQGLEQDGICGSKTQASLGFLRVKNLKLVVLEIPFARITEARVCLKDEKAYSVGKFATDGGFDIVVNGGLFSNTDRANCTDLVLDGKIMNGGNYSDRGIAFGRNFREIGAYQSQTILCKGKSVDFMGGCPPLILNGAKHTDLKGLTRSFMNSVTRRMATGLTRDSFIVMFSTVNVTAYALQEEGLNLGLRFLMNHDGGGSQSIYMGGATVIPTDGRGIPSAIGLKLNR